MNTDYFKRVNKLTPTRFWINNPSPEEARKSIAAGAINCTTNPTYCMNQYKRETEQNDVNSVIDEVIKNVEDNNLAAELIQQKLVKRIMDIFLLLYEKNPGKEGLVSIQGNPLLEDDPRYIINKTLDYRKLSKNFIAKIPVTKSGLKAIEALIPENVPMIATEIMSVSQAIYTCEMYKRVSSQCGKQPPFYLTHITGILDEHLGNVVKKDNIDISPDILWQAGCIIARKQYKIFKERNYTGIMLGGGARGLHHFTEMVGSEMHITINWKGTADKLIESDPPVVYRMFNPAPQYVIDELINKIPDFKRGYFEDGLTVDEYTDYGPVELFRNTFIKGWEFLLAKIKERRQVI